MYSLYKVLIPFYFYSIRIASLVNAKARAWVKGRRQWKAELNTFVEYHKSKTGKRIWFHASSLGEFEQGRELIEIVRSNHPEAIIVLSFFSPSGYDKCKQYEAVDFICYFPSDIYSETEYFVDKLNPESAFFIKYDFWFNTLDVLQRKKIPCYFISSLFRPGHFLLNPLFISLLNKLKAAEKIFLQNEESFNLLHKAGFTNIEVCGDTRLDRVYRIANEQISIPGIEWFCDREKIFIAGSTWPDDLDVIAESIRKAILQDWKIIIAPHVTDEKSIHEIELLFPGKALRYSQLKGITSLPLLIIDSIGLLSRLYRHCSFAYVGGGFGRGIHNILEPAAHKKAICIGPRYQKFQEARDFIQSGIAFKIENAKQLETLFTEIPLKQNEIRSKLEDYFQNNLGASERIYEKTELKKGGMAVRQAHCNADDHQPLTTDD